MIDHEAILGLLSEMYRGLNIATTANTQAANQIAALKARIAELEGQDHGPPAP